MEDASLFSEPFEAWKARTKGTVAEWRRLNADLWTAIKASEHYHSGRSCREAKCDRYPNG